MKTMKRVGGGRGELRADSLGRSLAWAQRFGGAWAFVRFVVSISGPSAFG